MIDTNTFLSIGFAIVANFTNQVPIPRDSVPQTTNDLRSYIVGSPYRPVFLSLVDKRGAHFSIRDGAVESYESPRSYFQSRGNLDLARYMGNPRLDSNAVATLAAKTIERLAKGSNPLANVTPLVRRAKGKVAGKEIPFYRFTWRLPSDISTYGYAAQLEIDARSGEVTSLDLYDPAFFDAASAKYVSDTVYRPEPKPKVQVPLPSRDRFRIPTTNEVRAGIASWLTLCTKLNLNPGSDTEVSRVDWDRSYVYTNLSISSTKPVCQIHLKNGTRFECVDSVAVSHFCDDACFIDFWDDRPSDEWRRFDGKVARKWQDLAKELERRLTKQLALPEKLISSFPPAVSLAGADYGAQGLARCVVRWHVQSEDARLVGSGIEPRGALAAEFDLQSGAVKWIGFYDPALIATLTQTLSAPP